MGVKVELLASGTVAISSRLPGRVDSTTYVNRKEVPSLIQELLKLPPIDELAQAKPLVLYFENDHDIDDFIAVIQEVKPGLRSVKL